MFRVAIVAALAGVAAVPAAAPPQSQHAKLDRALEGMTAGKPQTCIEPTNVTEIKIVDGALLYKQGRNKLWRNDTNGGCSRGATDLIVTRSVVGRYCSGDIVETHARPGGMLTGACALGDFVPYTKQVSRRVP